MQIIFYIAILFVCSIFGILIFEKSLMDIGYPVIISVLLLGTLLLIANLISSLINRKIWTVGLSTIVATIYFIGWIEDFANWPWTTILFLLVGLATIYLRFFMQEIKGLIKT